MKLPVFFGKIFFFAFFVIVFFTGCTIKFRKELTDDVKFQHFVRRCLELKEDVFLRHSSGSNNSKSYTLKPPGFFSSIPPSIRAYLENPEAWNTYTEKILAIVPKGTRLYIYDVSHFSGLATDITRFFAKIDDPRFCNLPVDVLFLINRDFLHTEYDIDHRYLKFCE
jgi:hypothetical protein